MSTPACVEGLLSILRIEQSFRDLCGGGVNRKRNRTTEIGKQRIRFHLVSQKRVAQPSLQGGTCLKVELSSQLEYCKSSVCV